ncbi:unnamed protein product, partial [Closterium sp. NIES-54]
LLRSKVAIFDLDFDVIHFVMYALSVSAEGDYYRCVPPDPGIAAAALGASESGTLLGTAPVEALHTFMLDSGASRCFFCVSTTLTPLPPAVPVQLADPSGGSVIARSSTVLPCPASVSSSASGSNRTFLSCLCTLTEVVSSPPTSCRNFVVGRALSIMEVARTSMIHAAAIHFLWLFAVWGSRAFVRDTSAYKLFAHVIPSVFLGFVPDRLFPYRSSPLPPPPLFLSQGPPPVDPLPPQGPAPSGVSQVDPPPSVVPVEAAVDLGTARGTVSGGAEPGGAEPGGAEPGGAKTGGAEPKGAETGGAELRGAETGVAGPGGAETGGAELGGAEPGGAEPEGVEPGGAESEGAKSRGVEPQGAASSGGSAGASPRLGVPGGTAATGPGGALTRGIGAARTGGLGGARAEDPIDSGATGAGGSSAGGAEVGGAGAGGAGAVYPGGAHHEPASHPVLPVRTACRVPRLCPPPVPDTHAMALCPSSVPLPVPLPSPPESSLLAVPNPQSDPARAASLTVSRLLATALTNPSFHSDAASALVAELLDFAAACRLDYTTTFVAESASDRPPSIGGECALGTDVLQDMQEDFECLAAGVPRFASMLLALEGDPDAPDIPAPRSYTEAITGPCSSLWQSAMDAEMASCKSIGTYVDEVPPPRANIGVDYFQTFSPTPKMTTLRVLLHVAAQRDYKLHSLDFSTAFLQGNLHEEIRLLRPPGFTGSFPADTQWSLRRPVYGLRQAPREWHGTLRTTLAALGFAPFNADPSLALTLLKSELQKRHTYTDLGELRNYLGLQITRDRARCTITLTQSHMVHQVLQRFGFQFSSPQPTPLSTSHSLSAPPLDESVEPSGPYPELMGCLIYLMTCTRPDLVYPLCLLAHYMAPGRAPVVLTGHADASWVDDSATQRSAQGYTFSLGAMAAQELRWLTHLLTDLGEQPRSPPVLYVDNNAMTAL